MRYGLQDWVNGLSDGKGVTVIRGFLWVAFLASFLGLHYFTQYGGLTRSDAMDQAQVARNLVMNGRFETHVVRPLDCWIFDRASKPLNTSGAIPEIRMAPAYPWLLSQVMPSTPPTAAAMAVRRDVVRTERHIIPVLGILLTIATGFIIFGLGLHLFDGRVARVSLMVYGVTASVHQAAFSGTGLPLSIFLVTALIALCVWVHPDGASPRVSVMSWCGLVVAGLLAAACILSNYALALMLLPVCLILGASCGRYRWSAVALVSLLAIGLVLPWLIRNLNVSGQLLGAAPFAALHDSLLYAGGDVDRAMTPLTHRSYLLPAIRLKVLEGFGTAMDEQFRLLGGGLVVCCFWVSLFYRFDEDRINVLKWSSVSGLLLLAGICAFDRSLIEYLNVFLPVMVLLGVAFLAVFMERLMFVDDGTRGYLLGSLVLLAALPMLVQTLGTSPKTAYPPYYPPTAEYVAGVMDQGESIATDIPWATAWYGNQTSILLPGHVDDLQRLTERGFDIGGLYLTQALSDKPYMSGLAASYASDRSWLPLLNRQVPTALPYVHGLVLPEGARDQLFLTDRIRWESLDELPVVDAPTNAQAHAAAGGSASL
jgi:hypothetical protein